MLRNSVRCISGIYPTICNLSYQVIYTAHFLVVRVLPEYGRENCTKCLQRKWCEMRHNKKSFDFSFEISRFRSCELLWRTPRQNRTNRKQTEYEWIISKRSMNAERRRLTIWGMLCLDPTPNTPSVDSETDHKMHSAVDTSNRLSNVAETYPYTHHL